MGETNVGFRHGALLVWIPQAQALGRKDIVYNICDIFWFSYCQIFLFAAYVFYAITQLFVKKVKP